MAKISKQFITFLIAACICICFNGLLSLATVNPVIDNITPASPSRLTAIPSSECKPIGDDKEKEDKLASDLNRYMRSKGYDVSTGSKEYNIVYIEGACEDGTANADEFDVFNDRRIVMEFADGKPTITNHWLATTEPGKYWTYNPYNGYAAARIQINQFKSTWRIGIHKGPSAGSVAHKALIQARPITVHRDVNRDGKRTRDQIQRGNFAINQHRGFGGNKNIDRQSAGCLVGWRPAGHTEFMAILEEDARYQRNPQYLFTTTIIDGDDFAKFTNKESIDNE
jgi:hypothetical protein